MFASNVPKKQSNIRIRRHYKRGDLFKFHLTRMVMSCVKNIYHFSFWFKTKKLAVNVGEK